MRVEIKIEWPKLRPALLEAQFHFVFTALRLHLLEIHREPRGLDSDATLLLVLTSVLRAIIRVHYMWSVLIIGFWMSVDFNAHRVAGIAGLGLSDDPSLGHERISQSRFAVVDVGDHGHGPDSICG